MKKLIAEADDLGVQIWSDSGPDRDLPGGGARATQILTTQGLVARGERELELVGVQAAATRPALELLASVARFIHEGTKLELGETLNLGIATAMVVAGDKDRMRIVDADWPGTGKLAAESAVKILTMLCEDQGFALLREGAPEDARQLFEAARELDPLSVTARMGEAFSWRDQARHDKAEQFFSAALNLGVDIDDKRRALIHFERARAAADQGSAPDRVRALEDFSASRKLDPDNPEAAYEHAHLLFLTGSDAEARAALAEVARLTPALDKQALEDGAKMPHPPELSTIPDK